MASVAEYFALKKASNPEVRNIRGIENMMAMNAGKSDPYGVQGLANLPLSFAYGKATREASEYDEQAAQQTDSYMQQQFQQHKDDQVQKAAQDTFKNWLELGKQDPAAANSYAQNDPVLSKALPPGLKLKEKIDKDGWMAFDALSTDGTSKTSYQFNLSGLDEAKKKLQDMGIIGTPTADQWAEAMPQGFVFKLTGAAKPAAEEKDPKMTGHVVRDKNSPTGWSFAGDDGAIMTTGAPDPYKGKESSGGGGNAEQKGFSTWVTKYDGLMKARAVIEKGYDPLTGQVIPQTQIETAKQTVNDQIVKTERYMQATFPNEYKTYAGTPQQPQQQQTQGRQLDKATAANILRDAGGDKNKARQMARGLGFTF